MKLKYTLSILFLAVMIYSIADASIFIAASNRNFDTTDCYDDDLFIGGKAIRFQSEIDGDLIGGSQQFVFSGNCHGNINWAAQSLTIAGIVDNSVRSFAQTIEINAEIGRNLVAFGQNIKVGPGSIIGKDVSLFASSVEFEGNVDGKLTIKAEKVLIGGSINGDVNIEAASLEIKPNTKINGSLSYKTPEDIKIADSVVISGVTKWVQVDPDKKESQYLAFKPIIFTLITFLIISFVYYLWVFIWLLFLGNTLIIIITFLALIICGAVIVSLNKQFAKRTMLVLEKRLFPSMGLGLLLILLFPLASLIAFISFIGWPLGFLLLFAFGIFLFTGAIYTAQYLGCWIVRLLNIQKTSPSFLGLFLGIVILALLVLIPVIGGIALLVVLTSGLGAVVLSLEKFFDKKLQIPQDKSTEEQPV